MDHGSNTDFGGEEASPDTSTPHLWIFNLCLHLLNCANAEQLKALLQHFRRQLTEQ